jgi:hypothetical protein
LARLLAVEQKVKDAVGVIGPRRFMARFIPGASRDVQSDRFTDPDRLAASWSATRSMKALLRNLVAATDLTEELRHDDYPLLRVSSADHKPFSPPRTRKDDEVA